MVDSYVPYVSRPETALFCCNTCGVQFVTAELQRKHMKTEWHRYNLKRRVAQLPSVSSDVFADKVLKSHSNAEPERDDFGFIIDSRESKQKLRIGNKISRGRNNDVKRQRGSADGFSRSVSPAVSDASTTAESFDFSEFSLGDSVTHSNYLPSGSEYNYSESDSADFASTTEDDEYSDLGASEEELDESEEVSLTNCFYCGVDCEGIENNVRHMFDRHGLYLPERSYLHDLDGLLKFLGEVILLDHECIKCGFQGKNLESIRQHIHSKGHSRLPFESAEEKSVVEEFYNFSTPSDPSHSSSHHSVTFREGHDHVIIDMSKPTSELLLGTKMSHTLPSGSIIAHRTFARGHRPSSALTLRPESNRTVALVDRRFAPGLTPREVSKQAKHTQILEQKSKNRHERRTKLSRVNYQPHFRDEMLGG